LKTASSVLVSFYALITMTS